MKYEVRKTSIFVEITNSNKDMTKYTTTRIVFFSPTHTSARIARAIGEGIGMGRRIETDLTQDESEAPIDIREELVVIVAPVYGGRIAPIALQRIKRLHGHQSPAILVAVYGNRDYEDALLELRDTTIELGFTPLSAAAFIGEHSYSRPDLPIAAGRPDEADLQQAFRFGADSLKKLETEGFAALASQKLYVKGNFPYKPFALRSSDIPFCNDLCYACGACIEVCPTHAIRLNKESNAIETDAERCIKCCACVKECPNEARILRPPFAQILHEKCNDRKVPELFL